MTTFAVSEHRLVGERIRSVDSPNHSGGFGNALPQMVVVHFTAGRSLASSVAILSNPESGAGSHLLVGRDGEIVQMLPFNRKGIHAGKSAWQGIEDIDGCSLSIELDNAGELALKGNKYVSWLNHEYPEHEVYFGRHQSQKRASYWHKYTARQLETVTALCRVLCSTYGIQTILGHDEIAPTRKVDPGPAFPMDDLRREVLGVDNHHQPVVALQSRLAKPARAVIIGSDVCLRAGPDNAQPIVGAPLRGGTEVDVFLREDGWAQIGEKSRGWVHTSHLRHLD